MVFDLVVVKDQLDTKLKVIHPHCTTWRDTHNSIAFIQSASWQETIGANEQHIILGSVAIRNANVCTWTFSPRVVSLSTFTSLHQRFDFSFSGMFSLRSTYAWNFL